MDYLFRRNKSRKKKKLIQQLGFKFLFMLSLIDATLLVATLLVQFCIMFISFYVNLLALEEKK
jgi:hypothetical protein